MSKYTEALYELHKAGRAVRASAISAKWQLLPATHPTVVRRLARELNRAGWMRGRAFYIHGSKWNCARVRKGQLEIGMCQEDWVAVSPESHFDDGNGNAIVAHRTVCGH